MAKKRWKNPETSTVVVASPTLAAPVVATLAAPTWHNKKTWKSPAATSAAAPAWKSSAKVPSLQSLDSTIKFLMDNPDPHLEHANALRLLNEARNELVGLSKF